jgi:hypothetical protein
MTSPFTTRPDDDPTNVLQWLAGRGAGRGLQGTAPRATPGPPEQVDAVEAPQRLEISPQSLQPEKILEADNSADPVKKAEPRKADNCGHCGKPLATLRSAASRYCDRYCAKAARKARGGTTLTMPRVSGAIPRFVPVTTISI